MINKPKIGEKCNGCGICCRNQVCMNGAYVLKLVDTLGETVKRPCPAIVENKDGSISCGIILNPNKYIKNSKYPAKVLSSNFAFLVGAGSGCDEILTNDTEEEEHKLEEIINKMKSSKEWQEKAQRALKIIHNF